LFNSAGVGLVTGAELRKHYFNSSPEPLDTVPNRGRALVVDDDRDNREYVAGILRKGGFDVVEARDGRTGLRTHRTSDEGFAVVVSDWSMPYMMGTEMVQKIRELSPEQPVLMMSSEPGSVRRILTELNIFDVKVLFKSYEPEEMLTAVLKTIVGEVANEVAH
jgi:DNA-binding response OmpR family regulator